MVQLVFDAPTAQEALTVRPGLAAYAQHEGAEVADWADDDRVAKVGEHPVVYPAEGSHAAFLTQAVWFGNRLYVAAGSRTRGATEINSQEVYTPGR